MAECMQLPGSVSSGCLEPAVHSVRIVLVNGRAGIALPKCSRCTAWLMKRFEGDPERAVEVSFL